MTIFSSNPKTRAVVVSVLFLLHQASALVIRAEADPARFVDPFIGTSNGGHVFAGSTLPFAPVKAVADSHSSDNQGGYVSDGSPIVGISPLHDDGTGGGASMGQFKAFPTFCSGGLDTCVTQETSRMVSPVSGSPSGCPGYFSIGLQNGYTAEVTTTNHAAIHRFTTNWSAQSPVLLFDLTNDLSHSFQGNGNLNIQTLTAQRQGQTITRLTGGGEWNPSFGIGTYDVYFCLDVVGVANYAIYDNGAINIGATSLPSEGSPGDQLGALLQMPNGTSSFVARIGVSWMSSGKACTYAESEIPLITSQGFDETQMNARAVWNELLTNVQVDATGVSSNTQTLFWSSLYRSFISPMNVTGDNPLWPDSTEPYYDSYYCIWDSFRVVHPLWTIVQPQAQAEVIRALIDVYRHTGWLPDCRMSTDMGYTQGGSNADSLLSDSFVKGISAGINWMDGYAAVVRDATVEPTLWGVQGRGGIKSRAQLGYIPVGDTSDAVSTVNTVGRSASRLLEYSYNDFSIALIAKGVGDYQGYKYYLNKSMDALNLWDPTVQSAGFTGFIQPRYSSGEFMYVDPRMCSPVLGHTSCYLNPQGGEFYEASSWQYSFYFPHNMQDVIQNYMGGTSTFLNRLDTLFKNGYSDVGDEPGFMPTFLYNYGGRPDKTVDRVLSTLNTYFSTETAGIPGNDDSGAMGAYAVWASLGFFPVAGQNTYLLSTPLFRSVTFTNPVTGTKATITANNWDGATTNKYVQSAKLNGRTYTKNWINHEIFSKGGTLELTLGSRPSSWGTQPGDLPPSITTGGF
ncbi:alpha-1-2-mannosidase family protein [Dacryopinax primogenitus]|uniref:Alpha-1-2-mannosidase family protein n=1 Tax=Dacryopinax primogenitus (strain DJM 731) TaxID=1858805 RepID=M5G8R9_DACPD|nr:alpha-1-2-mannosidase family protein [Dacryopinax primogenitus]EJU00163.1 alpha-1-2-mannosidase family protein [Dacryopinax primogenitus]